MQKLCCVRTRQHLCQFGLFRHNFTTVSPPILNHFWWELYHLTSAGASFRNHLADSMRHLGYHSCLVAPDLWYKPMVCPEDNFKYYSYVLLYVDDCLCICHNAEQELRKIDKFFKMKDGSVGDPDIYLGAKVKQMELPNGVKAWALSSSKYIQEAVQNCEKYLAHSMNGRKLT